MLAEGSKLSVLTVFRTNDISDYIPVTRGDMLDNGTNPDNAVMLLLCLTDSLLGCLPELYFPNSEPFQAILVFSSAARFVTSAPDLHPLPCTVHLQAEKPPATPESWPQ